MIFSRESLYGWGVCDIPMPRLGRGTKSSPEGRCSIIGASLSILRRDLLWVELLLFLLLILLFFLGLFFIAERLPRPEEDVVRDDVDIMVRLAQEPAPIPDVVLPTPVPPPVEEMVETVVEEAPPPVPLPPPVEVVKAPERVAEPPKPVWREKPAPTKVDLPKPTETPRRIEREMRDMLIDSPQLPEFAEKTPPAITVEPEFASQVRRVERSSSQLPRQTFDQTLFVPESTAKPLLQPQDLSVKKVPLQKRADRQTLEEGGIAFEAQSEVSLQSASIRRAVAPQRQEEALLAPTSTFEPARSSGVALPDSSVASKRPYEKKDSSGVDPTLSYEPLPRLQSTKPQVALNGPDLKKGISPLKTSGKGAPERLRGIDVAAFLQRPVEQIDPGLLVTLNEQKTCVDPTAERPLKARLASLVVSDGSFQGAGMIFYINNADVGDQIQIKILNYGLSDLPDRCTLLEGAISSVQNSMK